MEIQQSDEDKFKRCEECKLVNTGYTWCNSCNSKRFKSEFDKWTSDNEEIDKFIRETQLKANNHREIIEWIPYNKFKCIDFLAKGGFGTVCKATWIDGYIKSWDHKNQKWKRICDELVCLKTLDDSEHISDDFFREVKNQLRFSGDAAIPIYGITKDPDKRDYSIVMRYAAQGSLRKMLDEKYNTLDWTKKIKILDFIADGLAKIHETGLIHKDFHSGNIVVTSFGTSFIADFGLCKPVTQDSSCKDIFGVLPYVAPEVLKGKEYTQASDVYSFGIIMTEVITGYPPYNDLPHDQNLAIQICRGSRPVIRCQVPQLLLDLINQCLDAEPKNRPTAENLKDTMFQYREELIFGLETEFVGQIMFIEESTEDIPTYDPGKSARFNYSTHAQAVYTSRLLGFENLPDPSNAASAETEQLDLKLPDLNELIIEE